MGSMGTVTRLVCTPEGPCPLGAELKLAMEFTATAPVPGAHWTVTYTVDMTGKRHVVNVGATNRADLPEGKSSMDFHSSSINLEGVKRKWLNNVGLLVATLRNDANEEIFTVNMVAQVMEEDGALMRNVISPLE